MKNLAGSSIPYIRLFLGLLAVVCHARGAWAQSAAHPEARGAFELATVKEQSPLAVGAVEQLRFSTDGKGSLAVTIDGQTRTFAFGDIVSLARVSDLVAPSQAGQLIVLPDGDRLFATPTRADQNQLELKADTLGAPLVVPLDRVMGLLFNSRGGHAEAARLIASIRDPSREGEQLWLSNGDAQKGSFAGLEADTVRFDPGGGEVRFEAERVSAVGFDPALLAYPRPPGPFLELALDDGSRLGMLDAALEGGRLKGTARLGPKVDLDWNRVASIYVRNGPVAYLSSRDPAATQFVAYLDRHPKMIGRDTTWDGQPIRIGGRTHPFGLGMLPRTLAAYRIEPGDTRFQATIALDDRSGDLANVIFRVMLDRKEVFVSQPMGRNDKPIPVDINLAGASALVLTVEFGERGDVQDSAVWADARVLRNAATR